APKHKGISYVLVPMTDQTTSVANGTARGSNGFELRPIRQPTGGAHFTETFITEARAPLFNVIGGLHNGWQVTMTTLGNERRCNGTSSGSASSGYRRGLCHRMAEKQELAAKGMTLAWWAQEIPDHKAIISEQGDRTFAELNANANRVVRALRARGLGTGDAV